LGNFITRKELGFVFYGGPVALIETKKNHLEPEKIHHLGSNHFACEHGFFAISPDMVYRYGKQPIVIFRSHGHYLPKELVDSFYKLYYKKRFITLKNELSKIYPSINQKKFSSINDVFQHIADSTEHNSIDLDTEKYLPWFRAYNPVNKKRTNEFGWKGIEAIKSLRPRVKKLLPIAAIMIAILIFAVVSQDIPTWIGQIREAIGGIGR